MPIKPKTIQVVGKPKNHSEKRKSSPTNMMIPSNNPGQNLVNNFVGKHEPQ